MKKTEKYIYLVLGIILVVVIACSITYIVTKNSDKTETKVEQNDNKEESNNEEESKNEQITLSNEKLEEYLSYVPIEAGYKHDVYKNKTTNLENIDKDLLRNMAIIVASDCLYEEYTCEYNHEQEKVVEVNYDSYSETVITNNYIPLDYINKLLHQMYNYEINALNENTILDAGGMGYIYSNGYFLMIGGGWTATEHISYIDSYYATEEEVIIYEYAAYYDVFDTKKLYDYYNDIVVDIEQKDLEYINNYLKNNKQDFTLYKHTFKKNDTGYYWYQTEIASEE